MRVFVLVVLFCASASANCGCLKCSKQLQAVEVPGPDGRPVKVIFERPNPPCDCCGPAAQPGIIQVPEVAVAAPSAPPRSYSYQVHHPCPLHVAQTQPCGQQYSAILQVPQRQPSKLSALLRNLRFRTDRVLVPSWNRTSDAPTTLQNCGCPSCCCHCTRSAPFSSFRVSDDRAKRRCKRQLPFNWVRHMVPWQGKVPLHPNAQKTRSDSSISGKLEQLRNSFRQKQAATPDVSLRARLFGPAKLSEARSQSVNEASLLKKLKRLNNNPFCADMEEQATTFMRKLLQPPSAKSRPKRTIVVGSDELDLPVHYKVDLESSEEEPQEEEAPVVGQFPRHLAGRRLFPQPDLIMGKNVIQKVVRDELNAHQKKLDREQRLKGRGSGIPQNPIYLLLTAPMQFLDHFRKGGSPMTALPKMVFTAKRCLKDLGQNFHKHCLNLASNVIGDFDQVQPHILDKIGGRYRREAAGNFRARKKRYVIKVVDDDDIQHEVEDYLAQKMDHKFSYLRPLQDYYDKVSELFAGLRSDEPKVKLTEIKPRIIIDNKGLPFMEYDGLKRPLRLNSRRGGWSQFRAGSAEETSNRITALMARARQDPEVVGNAPKDHLPPKQILKERISALLEEVDQLVQLDPEHYDQLFELLIRLQHVKASIEQDWKRIIMDNKLDDMTAKIELLSKFKELQNLKNESVKNIAVALKKTDNEFVRKQLIHCLVRLQKLQCLVTSVVEDCEQHLKTRTPFNTKKEVKYVDTLVELKFVYSKTRSDLVDKLDRDRDLEAQKYMEMLHRLKKLLVKADHEPEKFEQAAKLVWELSNLEKLLTQTVKELNKKLARSYRIKKEMKILFDLQKRFEECQAELEELLGGARELPQKKDLKQIVAEIRRRHEDTLQKAKERAAKLKTS